MKLRSLQLEQFKKFSQGVGIVDFADGLNLIAGPNEMGKSTLLLALRAALFERHGSKSQAIKALQPSHVQGASPSVSVELDMDDGLYKIEKRFLRRAMAKLTRPDGQVAEGHEAEIAIQALLQLDHDPALPLDKGSPGHFGVILTPQSQSFYQPTLTPGTRHTLEEAITAEIEQLGNQSEVDAILANVEMEAFTLVDKRGKPKGRHREISVRLEDLEREIEALEHDRAALADDFQALDQAKTELQSSENGDTLDDLRQALDDLEKKRGDLIRQQEIESKLTAQHYRVDRLRLTRGQWEKLQSEQARLAAELKDIAREANVAETQRATLETDLTNCQDERRSLMEADETNRQKRQAFEQLRQHLSQHAQINDALLAIATEVTIDLEPEALDQVCLNNQSMERAQEIVQVIDGLTIDIQKIGQVKILPKHDKLDELRDHRSKLDRSISDLLETLALDSTEPDLIEEAWLEIEEETARLSLAQAELDESLNDLERMVQEQKSAFHIHGTKRQQIEARLSAIADEIKTDETLNNMDDAFEKTLLAAEAELVAAKESAKKLTVSEQPIAPALDQLETEIKALKRQIEDRTQTINNAKLLIGRLSATIAVRSERGLDERLEDCLRRRDILSRELKRLQLDAKALALLKDTLINAANDAKAKFQAPLTAKLTPYVRSLLPDATLEVTADFEIAALNRSQPTSERFEQLSDGTREQIAVLTRLAYAQMLKEEGRPALVVLDDALVFSDEQRLRRMFDILEKAAETMQIIIMTCREDRFVDMNAKRLQIEQQAEAA